MYVLLMLIATVPALVANVFEHFFTSFRIAERHHSHHDTYVVPPLFTRGIALCLWSRLFWATSRRSCASWASTRQIP